MSRICVAPDHRHFEKDGKPFFLMADTAWSSFTNPTMEEWVEYLALRREQGYNSLLINILPQWDRGLATGEKACPFSGEDHAIWHFEDIPSSYFEHACAMLDKILEFGMTPVLVLLWSNYTKGTFFDRLWGHTPLAEESVEKYVTFVANLFRKYEPLYFISGDTNFTEQVVDDYYLPALRALKRTDSEALASLHICGAGFHTPEIIEQSIPARLLYSSDLDFYTYQSGHFDFFTERCRECAQAFTHLKEVKPVLNAEPCYDGWDTKTGAHGRREMRRTAYLSILNGASAGLGHGAQGVWQWLRKGDFFAPTHVKDVPKLYECIEPFYAKEAAALDGAQDRAFAAELVKRHGLYALEACHDYESGNPDMCMGRMPDGSAFMLYIPRNQKTLVKLPAEEYRFTLYHLDSRTTLQPQITAADGGFVLEPAGLNSDYVLVGERK